MLKTLMYGVGFILMAQLFGRALGLQCYECMGQKGVKNDCEVNLANVMVRNCTPGFVCTIFVTTSGNQSTIRRLCSESNECEVVRAENTHTLGNVTVDSCLTCATDYCNSANSYISSFSFVSLLLSSVGLISINMAFSKVLM